GKHHPEIGASLGPGDINKTALTIEIPGMGHRQRRALPQGIALHIDMVGIGKTDADGIAKAPLGSTLVLPVGAWPGRIPLTMLEQEIRPVVVVEARGQGEDLYTVPQHLELFPKLGLAFAQGSIGGHGSSPSWPRPAA